MKGIQRLLDYHDVKRFSFTIMFWLKKHRRDGLMGLKPVLYQSIAAQLRAVQDAVSEQQTKQNILKRNA